MLTYMIDYRKQQNKQKKRENTKKMVRIIPRISDITMNKYGMIQSDIRKISDWLKKIFKSMQSPRVQTRKDST